MKIDLTIRQLLMQSGVLGILLVLLIAGASLFNSMRLNDAVASANRTTEALRLQMDADMRHDAIIGGVYGALLAAERGERDSLPVKRKELSEDIDRLRQDIAELARLNLDPQVQAQLKAVEPALEEYARSALAIVDAAMQSSGTLHVFAGSP